MLPGAETLRSKPDGLEGHTLTVGNICDLTQDVVSAYLFVALRWADQCLADHGNIDFGTNTLVCGLRRENKTM